MRYPVSLFVLAAFLSPVPLSLAAGTETTRVAAGANSSQAERNAVELKQGMSADDVQRLLGKPRRTSLKSGGSGGSSTAATLQWTYNWSSPSSPASLHVDFASKAPETWYVTGWDWSGY